MVWVERRTVLAAVFAAALLLSGAPAEGRELYVDCHAGSGAPESRVFSTVSAALAEARRGDEVRVAECIYRENLTVPPGVSLRGGYGSFAEFFRPGPDRKKRVWRVPDPQPRTRLTIIEAADPALPVVALSRETLVEGFVLRGGSAGVEHRSGPNTGRLTSVVRDCIIEDNVIGVNYVEDVPIDTPDYPVNILVPRLERSLVVGNWRGMVIDIDPHYDGDTCGGYPLPNDLDIGLDKVSLSYNRDFGLFFLEDGMMAGCDTRVLLDFGRTMIRNNGHEGMKLWTGFHGRRESFYDHPLIFRFHDSWLEHNLGFRGGLWRGTNDATTDLFEFRRIAVRENHGDGLQFGGCCGEPFYLLDHSLVAGNEAYGIWMLSQSPWTTEWFTDNVIRDNGQIGIAVDDGAQIVDDFGRNTITHNRYGGFIGFFSGFFASFDHNPERHNEFSDNGDFDFGCLYCTIAEGDTATDIRHSYWGPGPWTAETLDQRILDDEPWQPDGYPSLFVPWSTAPPKRVVARLLPGPGRVREGGRISARLTIDLTEAKSLLAGVDVDVVWDPTVLRLAGQTVPQELIHSSEQGPATVNANASNPRKGRLRIAGTFSDPRAGKVGLAKLEFEAVSPAGWHSALELEFKTLVGTGGEDLLPFLWHVPEYVRVREDTVHGDVTGDGQVTREDAAAVLNEQVHELGPWRQRAAIDDGLAELNGDGTTDATDANVILSALAGLNVPEKTGTPARETASISFDQDSDPDAAPIAGLAGEKLTYAQIFSVGFPAKKVPFLYALLIRKETLQRLGSLGVDVHFSGIYRPTRWWVPEGVSVGVAAGNWDADNYATIRSGFRFAIADPIGWDGDFVPFVLELWTWRDTIDPRGVFWVEFETLGSTAPQYSNLLDVVEERPELVNETTIELPFVPAPPPFKEEQGVIESADGSRNDPFPPEARRKMEEHHRDR